MSSTSVIEIDLGRIAHNVHVLRSRLTTGTRLCCVLKADAYGLGAVRIARWLDQCGVDLLAVYTLDQAEEILSARVSAGVLVLMPVRELSSRGTIVRAMERRQLEFVCHDIDQVRMLADHAAQLGVDVPAHVEIDTGMGRGGVQIPEVGTVLQAITQTPGVHLRGMMTHFACSATDPAVTAQQFELFERVISEHQTILSSVEDCVYHAASTHGIWLDDRYHLDMVRVGLGWIGCGPEMMHDADDPQRAGLLPAVTWTSRVAHVKWVEAGSAVGYGRTWIAPRRTRLGLVPVGYADGYPSALSNRSRIGLRTPSGIVTVPVVGRVSMDQLMIDLTDCTLVSSDGDVGVGTVVELISQHRNSPMHASVLAQQAGVEPYMLFTGLSSRIARRYRNKIEILRAGLSASGSASADVG